MKRPVQDFQWDAGNWPKCGKHGVAREDIERVIAGARFVIDDPSEGERRFRTVGVAANGRHVFAVYTLRDVGGISFFRAISARYMHAEEIESYEEAMARLDQR
jgi:uncharacterized protein